MNPSLPELINKAQKDLLEAMISALEKDEMTADESQESAREVVRVLGYVQSYTELLLFLRDLSSKYAAYKGVYVSFKQFETAFKDQRKLEAVQAKLQKLTSLAS